jgi:hypothetical protein
MNLTKVKSFESLDDIEAVIKSASGSSMQSFSSGAINKKHGVFRDAGRLQALVTLARSSSDKYLHIKNSSSQNEIIEQLCSYAPGLVALRLNKAVKTDSLDISRRTALAAARAKMIATDKGYYDQVIKGRSIDFCCVSGAEIQYLSPLFLARNKNAIKESADMKKTMNSLFKIVDQHSFNDLDGDLNEAFGVFACELFKNTQEHACTDENNIPYIEHVEGLLVSGEALSEQIHKKDFLGNIKLENYWDKESSKNPDNTIKLKCRQVSFFDTGPGIVGRAFPHTIFDSYDAERGALISCIKKSFTTKKQTGAGQGYPTILSNLSRVGGLIRIRSGNQCIFNCFDKDKHGFWMEIDDLEERAAAEEKYLTNFESWSNDQLSYASGTVVSILVPLRNDSGQRNLF